jgi:hypothetical protein
LHHHSIGAPLHGRPSRAIIQFYGLSNLYPLAQHDPSISQTKLIRAHQEKIPRFPTRPFPPSQANWKHFRIVHYEKVTGLKQAWQICNPVMSQRPVVPRDNQEASLISWLDWPISNQFGVKRKLELGETHQRSGVAMRRNSVPGK